MVSPSFDVRLLGGFEVRVGRETLRGFDTRKTESLFAYLVAHAGESHTRERLISEVWPDREPVKGRQSLTQALSVIRRMFRQLGHEDDPIVATRQTVTIERDRVASDVQRFRDLYLSSKSHALRAYAGALLPGHYDDWVVRLREELMSCHRVILREAGYQALLKRDVSAAREIAQRLLKIDALDEGAYRLLMSAAALGEDRSEVRRLYHRLVRLVRDELGGDPLDETIALYQELVGGGPARASDPRGSQSYDSLVAYVVIKGGELYWPGLYEWADAHNAVTQKIDDGVARVCFPNRQVIRTAISAFADESYQADVNPVLLLHVDAGDPSPDTDHVAREIAETCSPGSVVCTGSAFDAVSSFTQSIVPPVLLRTHLTEREGIAVYSVRGGRDTPGAVGFPRYESKFVGRTREFARLKVMYAESTTRPIRVAGPPGVGKTRFVTEALPSLSGSLTGPICFADLSSSSTESQLLRAVAAACGVRATASDALDRMAAELSGDVRTVVLDNLEHLEEIAKPALQTLSERIPNLRVVVTSRFVPDGEGDRALCLEPLDVPASLSVAEEILDSPSVHLFLQHLGPRAREFTADAAAIEQLARICRALEGVPLCLELVAARATVLGPRDVLPRIERDLLRVRVLAAIDRPTVFDLVHTSYTQLSPSARNLFEEIATFPGTFGIEALEGVSAATELLGSLHELKQHSLLYLVPGAESRYQMLPTIRQFAHTVMTPERRRDIERRLLEFYAQRIHGTGHLRFVDDRQAELAWFRGELENIRHCFDIARTHARHDEADADEMSRRALRMSYDLIMHWRQAALAIEGYEIAHEVVTWATLAPGTRHVALGRIAVAYLAMTCRKMDAARESASLAATVLLSIDDPEAQLLGRKSRMTETFALMQLTRLDEARAILNDALQSDLASDDSFLSEIHFNYGGVYYREGKHDLAMEHYERSLEIRERSGLESRLPPVLDSMAEIYRRRGDLDAAEAKLRRATEICQRLADSSSLAAVFVRRAMCSWMRSESEAAIELSLASVNLYLSNGDFDSLTAPTGLLALAHLALGFDHCGKELLRAYRDMSAVSGKPWPDLEESVSAVLKNTDLRPSTDESRINASNFRAHLSRVIPGYSSRS